MADGGEGGDVFLAGVVGGAAVEDGGVRGFGRGGRGGREQAGLLVVVVETGLDNARAEVQAVRHDGGAEDAAGLVEGGLLDEGARGEVPAEDVGDGGIFDEGELDAEADDNGEHEKHDEVLERSQAPHRPVGAVEEEDQQDLQNGERAAGYQRDLGYQQIQSNGRPDNLPTDGLAPFKIFTQSGKAHLGNVGGDDGRLGHGVQSVI